MKGYLLFEDGSMFTGKLVGNSKNVLGKVVSVGGDIHVACSKTGNEAGIAFEESTENAVKEKLHMTQMPLGKIVTDALPIEYHVYDIKTSI